MTEPTKTKRFADETPFEKIIHIYYWMKCGMAEISMPIQVAGFITLISIFLTQKGIYIPIWFIPVVAILVVGGCSLVGGLCQKYNVYSIMNTIINQQMNPEIKDLHDSIQTINKLAEDVKAIKITLEKIQ